MARLHAVRLRIGVKLTRVAAERALAHETMEELFGLGYIAHTIGAGVNAHLAGHALLVVNPNGAVFVLDACAGGASGNACGLCAVLAQHGGPLTMDVGPRALNALGQNRVVDNINRQFIPRTAGNRAGMTTDAATLVDDHSVTGHVNSFLLDRF